jgi:hypothetical protein
LDLALDPPGRWISILERDRGPLLGVIGAAESERRDMIDETKHVGCDVKHL